MYTDLVCKMVKINKLWWRKPAYSVSLSEAETNGAKLQSNYSVRRKASIFQAHDSENLKSPLFVCAYYTHTKQICTGAYLIISIYIGTQMCIWIYCCILPVLYVEQYLIYHSVSFSVANIDGWYLQVTTMSFYRQYANWHNKCKFGKVIEIGCFGFVKTCNEKKHKQYNEWK